MHTYLFTAITKLIVPVPCLPPIAELQKNKNKKFYLSETSDKPLEH